MKRFFIFFSVVGIVLFQLAVSSFALEQASHKIINEYVGMREMNGFILDSYLTNYLGFSHGKDEIVKSGRKTQTLIELLKTGGNDEDKPFLTFRYLNHFHDPLKTSIFDAGFSGIWNLYPESESAILWSQWAKGSQSFFGDNYSWFDTRDFFYQALISSTKEGRDNYFAKTFQGLGRLMHLISDMSVPEHTRDDGHYLGAAVRYTHYEQYVKGIIRDANYLNNYQPIFFDRATLCSKSQFAFASVPIANLFDRNVYDGDDPAVTRETNEVGLSEFTNANFLSPDTMFTEYPNPNVNDCHVDENRKYVSSDFISHLAAAGWLYQWRKVYFPNDKVKLPLHLDKKCYEEYASHLIPRAVGYSANILEYFFRGQLEISAPDEFVYAIIDGVIESGKTQQEFKKIKTKIRNISPKAKDAEGNITAYEPIGQGKLVAVAKYKKRPNYEADLSSDPPTGEDMQAVEFSYSVSKEKDIGSLSSEQPEPFEFDFSDNPIPVGITDLYLQVVFKGTLGNEEDDAIAVGLKDLNEPDHISVFNASDMVQYYGQLMFSWEVPEEYCQIDPFNINISVAILPLNSTSVSMYNATYQSLPPKRYGKFIVLVGEPYHKVFIKTEPGQYENIYDSSPRTSVINQLNGLQWDRSFTIQFRGVKSHYRYFYYVHCGTDYENENYPSLQGNDLLPFPGTILTP